MRLALLLVLVLTLCPVVFADSPASQAGSGVTFPLLLGALGLGIVGLSLSLGPRIPSAQDQAQNLINGASANSQKWLTNTLNPKKDPIDEAIKKAPAYVAGVTQALQEKRYEQGLSKVNKADMAATITAVGAQGYLSGIQARASKILASRQKLVPLQLAVVNKLDSMPAVTVSEKKAKMNANFDAQVQLGAQYRATK